MKLFASPNVGLNCTGYVQEVADCCVKLHIFVDFVILKYYKVVIVHVSGELDILNHAADELAKFVSTGIRGLMRGMATLLWGNQELLVVGDKVGITPGKLGVM